MCMYLDDEDDRERWGMSYGQSRIHLTHHESGCGDIIPPNLGNQSLSNQGQLCIVLPMGPGKNKREWHVLGGCLKRGVRVRKTKIGIRMLKSQFGIWVTYIKLRFDCRADLARELASRSGPHKTALEPPGSGRQNRTT